MIFLLMAVTFLVFQWFSTCKILHRQFLQKDRSSQNQLENCDESSYRFQELSALHMKETLSM